MSRVIVNGELCDAGDAMVSLLSKDVQLGLTVFETMLAVEGEIDGFELHMNRLQDGLGRLGIEISELNLLGEHVRSLLGENFLLEKRARVRLTAMSGLYWIEASEAAVRDTEVSVILSEFVLNERRVTAGIKCGSYAENVLALREGQMAGVNEVILLNTKGEVAEAATANVFIVKDGEIMTPALDSGCLPGVTRELVMQRARRAGMKVSEEKIALEDLLDADEVFLTNTQIGVQGVTRIGDLEYAAESGMDEVTRRVRAIYLAK
jgi:branched-chain amino acid aminotransferase